MKTVMVVDDELAIRSLLVDALADEGYRAIAVENGRRAVDVAKAERPDLIITDLMLPGIDGREIIKRIHAMAELAHTPIVLMSAMTLADPADVDFVPKPFDVDEMLELVARRVRGQAEAAPSAAATDAIASRRVNFPE